MIEFDLERLSPFWYTRRVIHFVDVRKIQGPSEPLMTGYTVIKRKAACGGDLTWRIWHSQYTKVYHESFYSPNSQKVTCRRCLKKIEKIYPKDM